MKIKYKSGLFLESLEFQRADELLRKASVNPLDAIVEQYGLLVTQIDENEYGDDWKVTKTGDLQVSVNAGKAVLLDAEGFPRKCTVTAKSLTLNSADAIYKILAKYVETSKEKGTVSLTAGSTFVQGNGTEFTKVLGSGRNLIVDGTMYLVDSVESDTTLTLASNPGIDLSDASYSVGGRFVDYPVSAADNEIYALDTVEIIATTGAKSNDEYYLADVTVSGGAITEVTDKRPENIFKLYGNVPTILGTTAQSFKVGDQFVELAGATPLPPLNFRIADVYAIQREAIDASVEGLIAEKYLLSSERANSLNVKLKWGYDDITGTGGSNSFVVTNPEYSFADHELKDHYLNGYKIIDNIGNQLSIRTANQNDVDLTGISFTTDSPAKIHANPKKYVLSVIPYYNGTYHLDERQDYEIIQTADYVTTKTVPLRVGVTYLLKIKSVNGSYDSDFSELESGSYIKYTVTQNYDKPFLCKPAQISSVGANISATATANGFKVSISGWTDAQEYEVCYTTDNAGADFTNPNHEKAIIQSKMIDITTSSSALYSVKVRPLIAGLQVATPIEKQVTSGSAGQTPDERIVAQIDINHITYSGLLDFDATTNRITVNSLNSPAGSSDAVEGDLSGKIITFDGVDYVVVLKMAANTYKIQSLSGGALPASSLADKPFEVGTSKRARRVFRTKLNGSYKLTRSEFDCQFVEGNNVTLREYQGVPSRESFADAVIISESDTQYTFPCDTYISDVYGELWLLVDLWDDATAQNNGSVNGRLVIYGKPYVNKVKDVQ